MVNLNNIIYSYIKGNQFNDTNDTVGAIRGRLPINHQVGVYPCSVFPDLNTGLSAMDAIRYHIWAKFYGRIYNKLKELSSSIHGDISDKDYLLLQELIASLDYVFLEDLSQLDDDGKRVCNRLNYSIPLDYN